MNELLALNLPIFILIGIGYGAAHFGLMGPRASEGLSDFVFSIATPALVLRTMTSAALPPSQPWGYWASYFIGVAAVWGTQDLDKREQVIIDCLKGVGLDDAQRKPDAPGVYIGWNKSLQKRQAFPTGQLAKIAALGIKIRKGCSYHGLSVNVDMDLSPFQWINPCGYAGLETVDLKSIGVKISLDEIKIHLVKNLMQKLDIASAAVSQSR